MLSSEPLAITRLETIVVSILNPKTDEICKVRLLLDTGSSHSFIQSFDVERLGLTVVDRRKIGVQPFGSSVDVRERNIISVQIIYQLHESQCNKIIDIKVIAVPTICNQINSYSISENQKTEIDLLNLQLADPEASQDGLLNIDLLIGQDYFHDIVEGSKLHLSSGLVMTKTIAGYAMGGLVNKSFDCVPCEPLPISLCIVNHSASFAEMSLEAEQQTLDQFVSLENIGISPTESSPILDSFNNTIQKNGNRYTIELPKKHEILAQLMTNFPQVFRRLKSGWAKMNRPSQNELKTKYIEIMEDQIEKGILEEVICLGTMSDIEWHLQNNPKYYDSIAVPHGIPVHYLPHFPVQKASDGSYRLVYDAKARPFKGHLSLNDCLEKGPSLINSLGDILIKFRLKKFVCKGDIAKAFLQIEVNEEDRDLLRLLWIRQDKVHIFRFARLPFGLTSSPFILAATLKYHLERSNLPPDLVKDILESFYVDDLVLSSDSAEELEERRLIIFKRLLEVGMLLRKWNTNHPSLRKSFQSDNEPLPDMETVLGLVWNVLEDTVNVNGDRIKCKANAACTKRGVYSSMAQIFDPIGLLSPYVFSCKLLVRDLWKRGLNWDDQLPTELSERWDCWRSELDLLKGFTLPRYIGLLKFTKQRLHGFCDASGLGFGAVIYLVTFTKDHVVSHLVTSKTRIAPSKITSVPRLELCSAVLLANLMTSVARLFKELDDTNIHFHTDSADVLYWLRSGSLTQSNDQTHFVSNRLNKIKQVSHSKQWHHVGSKMNPADIASRGSSLEKLSHNNLWLHGPTFIKEETLGPQTHIDMTTVPQGVRAETNHVRILMSKVQPVTSGLNEIISLEYTNDYNKLMRLTNIVLKVADTWLQKIKNKIPSQENKPKNEQTKLRTKWRHKDLKSISLLSKIGFIDTDEAELRWVREVQQQHFSELLHMCQGASDMVSSKTKSRCKNLRVFYDKDLKVLKIKTRLPYSELDESTINPILLPTESKLTSMLITSVHKRLLHAGVGQTLTALRGEFWFASGRREVSKVVNKCITCRKATGKTFALPPFPDLPEFRVQRCDPFLHVGIDFAGPFSVTLGGDGIKAYILIITCAATRAVWFEDTQGLSAYDFLLALKRFTGRRGFPRTIVSDNAKTFECCHKKLTAIFNNKEVQKYLSEHRIKLKFDWKFYCERAPWQGGFIERMVGNFKTIAKKIIGSSKMSYQEFATVVVEAESIINSRPLTYNYNSPDEESPLTPSQLLYGYNLTEIPPMRKDQHHLIPEVTGTSTLQRFWFLESVKTSFWNRWSKEYLTSLSDVHLKEARDKGVQAVPTVGEVVLLKKENTPRMKWKLARVIEAKVNPRDGKVRTCVVRTVNDEGKPSILNRSPSFLVPLELR